VWLADGRFPSAQALKDRDGEEEERRLFYVAATRAKDELYLSYPLVAAPRDRERVVMKASRFLEELPPAEPELFERWQLDEPAAGGAPALAAPPSPAALPPRDPRVLPALFGVPPVDAANEPPGAGCERGADRGEDDDVPF